jgi:hypothetical protein
MNDAIFTSNAPRPLVVGDRTYQLYPLDWTDHGEIQKWLDSQVRNPMDLVRSELARGGLPMEIQKYMVESAQKVWSRSRIPIGTAEANDLLGSPAGRTFLLYLSIRKGDKNFSLDDAQTVLTNMDDMARRDAIEAANVMGGDVSPKARETNGSTNTQTGHREHSTGGPGNGS